MCQTLITSQDWDLATWDSSMWDFSEEEEKQTEREEENDEVEIRPLIINKAKGPPGGQTQATRTVRDFSWQELSEISKNEKQHPN